METYGRNGGAYKTPVVLNLGISGVESSASSPLLHYRVLKNDGRRSRWLRGLRRGAYVRSLAGIRGSNPVGGMDVCLICR